MGARVDDEAAWELDDMTERVAPASYAESQSEMDAAAAGKTESEEANIKKDIHDS